MIQTTLEPKQGLIKLSKSEYREQILDNKLTNLSQKEKEAVLARVYG